MYIYQNNTYRINLDWLDLDKVPRVQEKVQVYVQQSHTPVSAAYEA